MTTFGKGLWSILIGTLLGTGGVAKAESYYAAGAEDDSQMWMLGFQLQAISDGPSPGFDPANPELAYGESTGSTHFGWGTGLTIPLTLNLYQGLGVRFALTTVFSGKPIFDPADTVVSYLTPEESNGQTYWVGPPNFSMLPSWVSGGSLAFNLHYAFPVLAGTFKPYLGVGPGLFLVYVFPDLPGDASYLLENEYNDINDDYNIDPYSVNFEPGLSSYVGVNFKVRGALHLNLEAAYDLAYMPEAPLLKATDGSDARRAAYYFSIVRISSGLLFNF